jgi:hypothetical protein
VWTHVQDLALLLNCGAEGCAMCSPGIETKEVLST